MINQDKVKENKYLVEELKYQATGIVVECEQLLNGWFFSEEYIDEKISKINALYNNIKEECQN